MKKFFYALFMGAIITTFSGLTSCKSASVREAPGIFATTSLTPVVLQNNPDGSVVVKVWGTGANTSEAVDNALKNALMATIYDGFSEGQGIAGQQPILPLVGTINARQKYSYYFNPFFSQGGEYLRYVTENINNTDSRVEANTSGRKSVAIIAVVDRTALKNRLIKDKIIIP